MSSQPLFGLGHNREPREIAAEAIAERLERYRDRVAEVTKSAESFVKIRDRVDVGQAADILGFAKSILELIEAEGKDAARPFDQAVGAIAVAVQEFVAPMIEARDALRRRADDWAVEEDARIRAQELEQAEFESGRRAEMGAAEGSAPLPAPALPSVRAPKRRTVRGDYGASLSIGTDYDIAITNWRELPDFVFQAEPVLQAIRSVVLPLVRKKVPIAGTTVSEIAKTTARRA
jgi:hypothetical protein